MTAQDTVEEIATPMTINDAADIAAIYNSKKIGALISRIGYQKSIVMPSTEMAFLIIKIIRRLDLLNQVELRSKEHPEKIKPSKREGVPDRLATAFGALGFEVSLEALIDLLESDEFAALVVEVEILNDADKSNTVH